MASSEVPSPNQRYIVRKVNKDAKYYYVNYDYPGLVWRNAIIFIVLHILYSYGFYLSLAKASWSSWLLSKYY